MGHSLFIRGCSLSSCSLKSSSTLWERHRDATSETYSILFSTLSFRLNTSSIIKVFLLWGEVPKQSIHPSNVFPSLPVDEVWPKQNKTPAAEGKALCGIRVRKIYSRGRLEICILRWHFEYVLTHCTQRSAMRAATSNRVLPSMHSLDFEDRQPPHGHTKKPLFFPLISII